MEVCRLIKIEDRLKGGVCGFWSPKQVINHFSDWAETALVIFEKTRAGLSVNTEFDDDSYNANAVAKRITMDWDSSLVEIENNKQKLVSFLQSLSIEEFNRSAIYSEWLTGIAEDYMLHHSQLEKWVPDENPGYSRKADD